MFEFANSMPGLISDGYNLNIMYLKQTEAINNIVDKQERTKNRNKNVPDNIIRHQFLSLLSKVAVDKYINKCNIIHVKYIQIIISSEYIQTNNRRNSICIRKSLYICDEKS